MCLVGNGVFVELLQLVPLAVDELWLAGDEIEEVNLFTVVACSVHQA